MPVASTELIIYGAASRPEDDTSTVGGAIDTTARPFDAGLASTTDVEFVSDGADTRGWTIRYRDAAGIVQSDTGSLNGTTPVASGISAERLLEVSLASGSASRTVVLRVISGGATIHTFNVNETHAFRLFNKAVSSASGAKVYYEKIFWKNTDSVLALLTAIHRLTSDPSAKIAVGIATAVGGTTTSTNRITAPAGITFVDDNVDQNVPGTDLAGTVAVAVWIRLSLLTDEPPIKSTLTLQLRGTSA